MSRIAILARFQNAERAACGISEATIRLSIGIEAVDDIVADLRRALDVVMNPSI